MRTKSIAYETLTKESECLFMDIQEIFKLRKDGVLKKNDYLLILALLLLGADENFISLKQKDVMKITTLTKSDTSKSFKSLQKTRMILRRNTSEYKLNLDSAYVDNYHEREMIWNYSKDVFREEFEKEEEGEYRKNHTKLVCNIALYLAESINLSDKLSSRELYILSVVSMIHDVFKNRKKHADIIAENFEDILDEILINGFDFEKSEIEIMRDALSDHGECCEQKDHSIVCILQDADKLSKYPYAFDINVLKLGFQVKESQLENYIEYVTEISPKHLKLNYDFSKKY